MNQPTKIKILCTVNTSTIQEARTEIKTCVQQNSGIRILYQQKQEQNVQQEDQKQQIQEQNDKFQYYEKLLKLSAQIALQRRKEELFKIKYKL